MAVSWHGAWTSDTKSLTRAIFGFLMFRQGMEQVLGFPEPSGAAWTSLDGIVRFCAFPGGLLLMLGWLTRPVAVVLSLSYLVQSFAGPGGPSDPTLLNAVFLFYLGLTGAGRWSLDRLLSPAEAMSESRWAPHALAALRVVAACLFIQHGIPKLFGSELPPIASTRLVAGVLEFFGGSLLLLGLFTRATAFVLSGEMAFAYFMTHAPRGFWGSFAAPNMEAAILYCFLFLFLWQAGPGSWSFDGLWQRRRISPGSEADRAGHPGPGPHPR